MFVILFFVSSFLIYLLNVVLIARSWSSIGLHGIFLALIWFSPCVCSRQHFGLLWLFLMKWHILHSKHNQTNEFKIVLPMRRIRNKKKQPNILPGNEATNTKYKWEKHGHMQCLSRLVFYNLFLSPLHDLQMATKYSVFLRLNSSWVHLKIVL